MFIVHAAHRIQHEIFHKLFRQVWTCLKYITHRCALSSPVIWCVFYRHSVYPLLIPLAYQHKVTASHSHCEKRPVCWHVPGFHALSLCCVNSAALLTETLEKKEKRRISLPIVHCIKLNIFNTDIINLYLILTPGLGPPNEGLGAHHSSAPIGDNADLHRDKELQRGHILPAAPLTFSDAA